MVPCIQFLVGENLWRLLKEIWARHFACSSSLLPPQMPNDCERWKKRFVDARHGLSWLHFIEFILFGPRHSWILNVAYFQLQISLRKALSGVFIGTKCVFMPYFVCFTDFPTFVFRTRASGCQSSTVTIATPISLTTLRGLSSNDLLPYSIT